MKVVGLISGGKDSLYNLIECQRNSHQIKCVANLHSNDELDSFMFQTVGTSLVPLIGKCLDLPLYSKAIKGKPINIDSDYNQTLNDETEDLYDLLCQVKADHADIEAVSVGAILSNYQRVRVEHVCRRLKLIPLTYLWRRDQLELLNDMNSSNQLSIVVKVAGAGLDPERHLGKSLHQLQPMLVKLNSIYGSHICGEGGEFETITLDSPIFKRRIVIDESDIIYHDPSPVAPVAYLRIKKAHLEEKDQSQVPQLSKPELFDSISKEVIENMKYNSSENVNINKDDKHLDNEYENGKLSIKSDGNWLAIANLTYDNDDSDIKDQTLKILTDAQNILLRHHMKLENNSLFVTVYLSTMSDFNEFNEIYNNFFKDTNFPPARVALATRMKKPSKIKLSILNNMDTTQRKNLTVTSFSYWAPANIAKYSQSISLENRFHLISGQISLIPSNLNLFKESIIKESTLSLQHTRKISGALSPIHIANSDLFMRIQSSICYFTSFENFDVCRKVLQTTHEIMLEKSIDAGGNIGDEQPQQLYLHVDSLPKNASVEWQTTYVDTSNDNNSYDTDDDDDDDNDNKKIHKSHHNTFVFWDTKSPLNSTFDVSPQTLACTVYYTTSTTVQLIEIFANYIISNSNAALTYVKVDGIGDKEGKAYEVAGSLFEL